MCGSSELKQRILELFRSELNVEIPSVETDLMEAGLMDSLLLVDLLMQLEKHLKFSVSIKDLDIEDFRTVTRMAELISRNGKDIDAA